MMMMELTSVPTGDLPVDAFATHLRLAEGFGDLPGQRAQLEGCLTAAMATLEARIGKYLLERRFILRTYKWTKTDCLVFPAAPVTQIEQVKIVHSGTDEIILDPASYALQQDAHRPSLVSRTGALPTLGRPSSAEITLVAGYSNTWENVPAALRQATFLLAELLYESDSESASINTLPCSVCLLVEPFRDIRLRGVHVS